VRPSLQKAIARTCQSRAAVAAMRVTFSRILSEGGIAGVEGTVATVAEAFALQGDERMRELEARFLR